MDRKKQAANRNAVKFIGLVLVAVFGVMAATPYLAAHTQLFDKLNFKWQLGGLTLVSVSHDVNGSAIGSASAITAAFALVGILLLAAVFTFAPMRKDRHVITHK